MIEALFLDAERNFDKVAQWLCDRFLDEAVEDYEDDPTLVSTWTELFDLGFWETPPTRGRSPFSYNYMMNLIVSTYLTADDYAEMMGLPRSNGVFFT